MSQHQKHQVVIVGGGITGLTLALMLQHLKVDYVLLEAYDTVTPNVGASIGLFANGLRLLDQLGLYEEILAKGQTVEVSIHRDANTGKRIMTRRTKPLIVERHGYPSIFMERYDLLCILYNHIIEKQRVLVHKKVQRIETLEDSAVVYTEDGPVFEAQVVVGADGVRSTVRKEMWRIADEKEPGAIPERDRQNISCEHACVFGTADPTPGIAAGDIVGACARGTAAGCMGGPSGEVFVFWFWALPQSMRSCPIDQIPRLTEEDKQRELSRGAETVVADSGLRFREVTDNLRYSGVTALPHFVLRRWHYGRIIILGDAAHKFNPLVGQGGNSCIESCASLVNTLQESLGSEFADKSSWVLPGVTQAFVAVEKQRIDRVVELVETCQDAMRRAAWESWRLELVQKYIVPLVSLPKFTDFYSAMITGGLRLKSFADPKAAHTWLYDDEKTVQAEPKKSLALTKAGAIKAIPIAALAAFIMARVLQQRPGLGIYTLLSRYLVDRVN